MNSPDLTSSRASLRPSLVERLRSEGESAFRKHYSLGMWAMCIEAADEIERLTLENWQLKGALGYPVPGDIPEGSFKCGLCDARSQFEDKTNAASS